MQQDNKKDFITRTRMMLSISVIAGLTFLAFYETLAYWFTGMDALPLILSNRLESPAEILKLFSREYLSAYRGQDIAGSVGVRPIGTLTFSVDYWVWQLNPAGYHATNLLIHILNSILVFFLVRAFQLRNWPLIGFLAAVFFALHPLHAATVPLISARFDLLLCTFLQLATITLFQYTRLSKRSALWLSLLFTVLALGTKESGVIFAPIAILVSVFRQIDGSEKFKSIWTVGFLFILVSAGFLFYRHMVLGELGGYPIRRQGFLYSVLLLSLRFFDPLLLPSSFTSANPLLLYITHLIKAGFVSLLLLFVLGGVLHYLVRRRIAFFTALEKRLDPNLPLIFFLSTCLVVFFAFNVCIFFLTGVFKPFYLYPVLPFWCILLSVLTVKFSSSFAENLKRNQRAWQATIRIGLLNGITGFLVISLLLGSPCFHRLDEWQTAGRVGRAFTEGIARTVARLPDATTLFLINLPHGIQCENCVGRTYMFEDYSIDAWIKLVLPQKRFRFISVSTIWLDPKIKTESSISYDPTQRVISVRNNSGVMEPPWHSDSKTYFILEKQEIRQMKIRLKDKQIMEKPHYFYDFLQPGKVFFVRGNELLEKVT